MEYKHRETPIWVSLLGVHPQATLEVISPLAGFVGSDLLAGVLATRLTEQPGGLLIDFGTNSEMALWDGQTLWVTSAAGGPAFESCGMQCGMPAEPGAIYRFGGLQDSDEVHFQVLGGGEAKGFCGSGLVDLIACLRDSGELTSAGSFRSHQPQGRLCRSSDGPGDPPRQERRGHLPARESSDRRRHQHDARPGPDERERS